MSGVRHRPIRERHDDTATIACPCGWSTTKPSMNQCNKDYTEHLAGVLGWEKRGSDDDDIAYCLASLPPEPRKRTLDDIRRTVSDGAPDPLHKMANRGTS